MTDMPFDSDEAPNVIAYRVRLLAKTAADLVSWQRGVDKTLTEHDGQLTELGKGMAVLGEKVDSNTKALIGLSISIALAALAFAFTVLTAVGKL